MEQRGRTDGGGRRTASQTGVGGSETVGRAAQDVTSWRLTIGVAIVHDGRSASDPKFAVAVFLSKKYKKAPTH